MRAARTRRRMLAAGERLVRGPPLRSRRRALTLPAQQRRGRSITAAVRARRRLFVAVRTDAQPRRDARGRHPPRWSRRTVARSLTARADPTAHRQRRPRRRLSSAPSCARRRGPTGAPSSRPVRPNSPPARMRGRPARPPRRRSTSGDPACRPRPTGPDLPRSRRRRDGVGSSPAASSSRAPRRRRAGRRQLGPSSMTRHPRTPQARRCTSVCCQPIRALTSRPHRRARGQDTFADCRACAPKTSDHSPATSSSSWRLRVAPRSNPRTTDLDAATAPLLGCPATRRTVKGGARDSVSGRAVAAEPLLRGAVAPSRRRPRRGGRCGTTLGHEPGRREGQRRRRRARPAAAAGPVRVEREVGQHDHELPGVPARGRRAGERGRLGQHDGAGRPQRVERGRRATLEVAPHRAGPARARARP